MKPFLLLQLREADTASDDEFEAFLRYGELNKSQVHRVRMEKKGVPDINLNDYSGIIEGGGPYNVSDAEVKKSAKQIKFEKELLPLYDKIFEADFPFLGACYGIGSLAMYKNGEVSRVNFSEPPGAVKIELSEVAKNDPILKNLPQYFDAFVGHKESCQVLPAGATLLASSSTCLIQMIRFKKNIYATQFHPELDFKGLELRVGVYMYEGYFNPEEASELLERNKDKKVFAPQLILKYFVVRYRRN